MSWWRLAVVLGGGLVLVTALLATTAEPRRSQAPATVTASTAPFDLEETTIEALLAAQRSGRRSARQIVETYLARIEALDRRGPSLGAVIELNPDALTIAETLDGERRRSGLRGPLHGIPVLIKDNIDTADRMSTTAGSLALQGHVASRDAFIVERLRSAGAVVLGKTNLSEWANFRSMRSTSGWSARGGLVRNPYALDRNACGSSSGTGAAIAANFAVVGVGTETDGSIVCPSAANALVGIKPTVGLVSRAGIIPIAHSQDTAGPMARTVTDAAHLLGVLASADPRDPATASRAAEATVSYAAALDRDGLRGARIGVARAQFFGYSQDADRLTNDAIDRMRAAGADIIDPADVPDVSTYRTSELEVLLYEFKHGLNGYLAGLGPNAKVRSLEALIAFNEAHRAAEMPHFGQELLVEAQKRGPLTDQAYLDAREQSRRLSRQGLDATLDRFKLDAVVAPTGAPPWKTDLVNGDTLVGSSSAPAAASGYPSITVPAGYADGLPVGITFIGRAWSEARLIKLAYAYEQATNHRRPPTFRPSTAAP